MRPVREGAALVGVGGGDAASSAAGHAHQVLWRTPTPYLFLGFALMMTLIAVALIVLVCTRRKPTGSSRRGSVAESARGARMAPLDREPKVVVIMAGDHMPSFLASARPFSLAAEQWTAGEPSKADAA